MPAAEDIPTGAVPFCPSVHIKSEGVRPAVTVHPFIGRNEGAEAARIVELVREGRGRGAKIAILIRARSHLAHILPALRGSGLRFRAVEIDSLAKEPLILDLTSLTRALLHTGDRIAWLSILRAPWCGLTLEDLHALVGDEAHAAVWNLIEDDGRVARLSPEAQERLTRVRDVLKTTMSQRPTSLRRWVEGAWLALGGPACAVGAADRDNADAFFALLEEMDAGGRLDPAALTRQIEKLHANPDPEADDGLQIMSIHKAKGLQWDMVIVPGLGHRPRSEEARLMLWLERMRLGGAADLLMAPIHATGADHDRTYDYLKLIDARKSEYEAGRLLYVAATRAKADLHLLGHTGFDAENGVIKLKDPEAGSLLKRMWDVARPIFQAASQTAQVPEAGVPAARKPQAIQRLVGDWIVPAPPASVAIPHLEPAEAGADEAVSFRWVGDTLRHIGTVIHQMLRRIAEDGVAGWDAALIDRQKSAYRTALLELGVPAGELANAVDRVASALNRTMDSQRGRWLLGEQLSAACEYSLTGVDGGEVVNVRIDRTFIDHDGTRWIIDYKSSSHEGADIEAFLDNERERYRGQLERYRRMLSTFEGRPVRMGLYFPLLNGWREMEEISGSA
jgi:ATP-dependent exoDNAse (exonuclease V) beta subunit